jgi:hypothetical protein
MSDHQPTRLVPLWRVSQVYGMPVRQLIDVVRYVGLSPIHHNGELVLTGKVMSGLSRFVSRTSRQHGDTIPRLRKSFPDAPAIPYTDFVEIREAA